jgi:HEAT repeat protein
MIIIIRRIIVEKIEKNFQRTYRMIEEDVLDAINTDSPKKAAAVGIKYRSQPKALTQVLINYAENVKGQAQENLRIVFETALKKNYLKNIRSMWVVKRLRAVRLFVLFATPEDSPLLIELMKDKPLVRLAVIQALSRLPSYQNISYIFDAFVQDPIPQSRAYINIMHGLGDKIESFVGEYITKALPVEKLALLIELAGSVPLRALYDKIIGFSNHPEKEIRIASARALGNFLMPEAQKDLVRLTKDDAWEVQAQAYKSLGKLKLSDSSEDLEKGLYSFNWHVRYNAGFGLAMLGISGIERLKAITKETKDRFASDMATMVLDSILYAEEAK